MLETTQNPGISPSISPSRAILRWPGSVPLAALISHPSPGIPFQRFSYLAPIHERLCPTKWLRASPNPNPPLTIPALSYELGTWIEPAVQPHLPQAGLGEVLICHAAFCFDHALGQWTILGDPALLPTLEDDELDAPFHVGVMTSLTGQADYEAKVARAIEYIRAGDIFQVNLAHRLRASLSGSSRALFTTLAERARPAYGAYLETSSQTILSLSPELFLACDAISRGCTTRPMKGTAGARSELESSLKDKAELRMIVDLMRNDLSRVCDIGSVRVDQARAIETHAGGDVHQGVSTISGALRKDKSLHDLIRATFPAGSVTGAPKVRAMQIIAELEKAPRGTYCGSIGAIDREGSATFSVGIRTATIRDTPHGRELQYPVGAGIVADSVPSLEWRETLLKGSVWSTVADGLDA